MVDRAFCLELDPDSLRESGRTLCERRKSAVVCFLQEVDDSWLVSDHIGKEFAWNDDALSIERNTFDWVPQFWGAFSYLLSGPEVLQNRVLIEKLALLKLCDFLGLVYPVLDSVSHFLRVDLKFGFGGCFRRLRQLVITAHAIFQNPSRVRPLC